MRAYITIVALMASVAVVAQNTAREDSLIDVGRMWRDNKNYSLALDNFMMAGCEESQYEIAATHYMMGKVGQALSECKSIIDADGKYALDAEVLTGLCREKQGFERAAKHIYKKLVSEKNSARAAYHYAAMLMRKGHLDDAEAMVQKSILIDKASPESHYLLASIEALKSNRFKTMLPLYYFLLINTDEDAQRQAYTQLVSLWRRSAQAMQLIKSKRDVDPFNDDVDAHINQWATSDSIAHLSGQEAIEALCGRTDMLLQYLQENSENNLDFWQVAYSDFLVTLVPRNFVRPYVYYISDAKYHAEVLQWVSEEEYLFNEFRLWMEAQ